MLVTELHSGQRVHMIANMDLTFLRSYCPPFLFNKHVFMIYLEIKVTERERKRNREVFHACWFTPQRTAMAQKPGAWSFICIFHAGAEAWAIFCYFFLGH